MKVKILNPKHVVYDGEATSVFAPGDRGEFEILPYHAPIISLLKPGAVIIDWKKRVPVTRGIIRFDNEECIALVE
jgi:F-type H+-transporting ATPase subunit epsilon